MSLAGFYAGNVTLGFDVKLNVNLFFDAGNVASGFDVRKNVALILDLIIHS